MASKPSHAILVFFGSVCAWLELSGIRHLAGRNAVRLAGGAAQHELLEIWSGLGSTSIPDVMVPQMELEKLALVTPHSIIINGLSI